MFCIGAVQNIRPSMNVQHVCLLVALLLAVSWCSEAVGEKQHTARRRIRPLFEDQLTLTRLRMENPKHHLVEEIAEQIRSRRQATGAPITHGDHLFSGDSNQFASIYYSGNSSPVILVLTYDRPDNPTRTNVYRSTDYGATFATITQSLGSPLWSNFYASPASNLVVFYHSTRPVIYISENEGATWRSVNLTPSTISPRSFLWNPRQERSAIAHDDTNNIIYVTQDLGQNWIQVAENVALPSDYQWGNSYDDDTSIIYYNSFDPNDVNRGPYTVGLYSQRSPYTAATKREVDPNLGRHDDFLLLGPYIFAQRNDSGIIHLYISYLRQPFNLTRIPTTDPHQGYLVTHINELQALVIVQHTSGKYNLYLSDITGVYFSLSLEDIVITRRGIDLELIDGINGTMIANRNVRVDSTTSVVQTVITLDNGGVWSYITPPQVNLSGLPVLCEPPSCSLHFHMVTSEYARLGVYSQESAPGIILAHGNIGGQLAQNPDLYISRDGGVSWYQTLAGSWGVTVVDHGGLLVAADDYHKDPSRVLKYSCNEGLSWNDYTYTNTDMTIYGVITEPGEETTTVSLYGTKTTVRAWDVVTVNFSSIFPRRCVSTDFYPWQPWDARSDTDCILGLDVTLERRFPQACCLIGPNYDRPVSARVCQCSIDDYECDFGFMPAEGFEGPCVPDPAVPLDDPCADGQVKTVMKSRGYRKIPGDVCTKGDINFEPYEFTCCVAGAGVATTSASHGDILTTVVYKYVTVSTSAGAFGLRTVVGMALVIAVSLLVIAILVIVAAVFIWKYLRLKSGGGASGRVQFRSVAGDRSGGEESAKLINAYTDEAENDDDDDDPPLAL